jgi:hypothetical protein
MVEIKVTGQTICVPSEDVVAREIEGDMIIVPLVAGLGDADDELYTLNETGKAIWKKLDGKRTLEKVSMELKKKFSSSIEEVKSDVVGFASEMVRRGILTIKNK